MTSPDHVEASFTKLLSEFDQHVATIVSVSKGVYTPDQVAAISTRASEDYSQYLEKADPVVRHPVGRIAILAKLLHEIEADGLLSSVQLARYVSREVRVAGTKGDATALETFTLRTLNELQRGINQLRRDIGIASDVAGLDDSSIRRYPPIGAEWPKWLTLETCAAYTSRSKRSIEGLVSRGDIPYIKHTSGRIYFDRTAIDSWVQKRWKRRSKIARG